MKASQEDLTAFIADNQSWSLRNGRLYKSFQWPGFTQAFAFMCEVAFLAEKRNHHPEWSNSYGKVEISLITHEIDGIGERDFDLARRIDTIANRRQGL